MPPSPGWLIPIVLLISSLISSGCDPQHTRQCEWVLLPYPEANHIIREGWVSVCVANFTIDRQQCLFQARPQLVNAFNGIRFRYSQMEYSSGMPKTIHRLKKC